MERLFKQHPNWKFAGMGFPTLKLDLEAPQFETSPYICLKRENQLTNRVGNRSDH